MSSTKAFTMRGAYQEIVHGLCHRVQCPGHRQLNAAGHLRAQGIGGRADKGIAVLILADDLHVVIQRALHRQGRKALRKVINGAVARTNCHPVQHIKRQAARCTHHRGIKGIAHAFHQLRNAFNKALGIRQIQGAYAAGQANKSTQDAQGSKQRWDQFRKLRISGTVNDRFIVNVFFHAAWQATPVQLLGVLQKALPGSLQAAAHEARLLPDGRFALGARAVLQAAHRTLQGAAVIPQGDKTFE